MNLSGPGASYIFLMIPTLFALTVVGQGVYKMARNQSDGQMVLGLGLLHAP